MSTAMSPERAIELLEAQIVEVSELRNAHARDPRFKQWRQSTLTAIQRIWPGEVARAERFRRVPFSPPSDRMSAKATRSFYEKGCAEALRLLREMVLELGSPATASPPDDHDTFEPGDTEDDFPVVDLDPAPAKNPAPAKPAAADAPSVPSFVRPDGTPRPAPGAREPHPLARPETPEAPPAAQATPADGKTRTPAAKTPTPPPIVVRGTRPKVVTPESPEPAKAPPPPRGADPRPGLREMLGFSATPEGATPTIDRRGEATSKPPSRWKPAEATPKPPVPEEPVYEELEAMEPESGSYEYDDEPVAEAEEFVSEEPMEEEPVADEPGPTQEPDRDEMEAFLLSSPVLKANARPVVRQRPAAEPASMQSATASALAALAGEVERLGVPDGHRAAVRAMLLDLARGLDRQDLDWKTLSESLRLALAYPPLARRIIPLLIPFLDLAA